MQILLICINDKWNLQRHLACPWFLHSLSHHELVFVNTCNRMVVLNTGLRGASVAFFFTLTIAIGATSVITSEGQRLTLSVDVTKSLHVTSRSYLSITISGGQLRKGLIGYDFSSEKLQNLAAELGPADVRIGGTYSDFLNFDPSSNEANCVDVSAQGGDYDYPETTIAPGAAADGNAKHDSFSSGQLDFTMSGKRWETLTKFCDQAGWDILWDFNLLDSRGEPWNPAKAKEFLEFSSSRGIKIPMLELGNEPNLYERKFGIDISAEKLVGDYETLRNVTAEMPQYAASGVYAPGVNNLDHFSSSRKYLTQFLQNRGCDVITEVALHHYYFQAEEAKTSDFTDLNVLEGLRDELEYAYNISWANCRLKKPIRFTETSTASGGGVPQVSNAYIAGFLWLDKLGLSATYGITRVFRQTFLKSSYALVTKTLKPNPDYYLSVLYKRLVEGPVFRVLDEGLSPQVRIYAHCVAKSKYYNYKDGAVVIYYLNIGDESSTLSLGEFLGAPVDLFILTPGDDKGLLSRKVKLNDQLLTMKTPELPALEPKSHTGDVTLAPKTFGFIVIPEADVQLCKDYHRYNDGVPVSC
ncbi:heparanase [Elysia marginata]|uniref:Heparanase n=1 Tax=Elysia marginata TaxID=1093978 RepID=A0AAV4I8P6_9GAST|nr:heparanase [Elysia marginata]